LNPRLAVGPGQADDRRVADVSGDLGYQAHRETTATTLSGIKAGSTPARGTWNQPTVEQTRKGVSMLLNLLATILSCLIFGFCLGRMNS